MLLMGVGGVCRRPPDHLRRDPAALRGREFWGSDTAGPDWEPPLRAGYCGRESAPGGRERPGLA